MAAGFNGQGVFLRGYDWTNDKAAQIRIQAVRMDEEMDAIATALSTCILRNGTATVTADIPMGSHKFTNLAQGTLPTDSVRLDQVSQLGGNNTFLGANKFVNQTDAALVNVVNFEGDRPTPTDGDTATISFGLSDDVGVQRAAGQIQWVATDVSATNFDTGLALAVTINGALKNIIGVNEAGLYPALSNTYALGFPTNGWLALNLSSNTVSGARAEVNWDNGLAKLSHTDPGTLRAIGGRTPLELYYSSNVPGISGPILMLYRDYSSPINGGAGPSLQYWGKDSNGTKTAYALITAKFLDVSDGSEDGELAFWTVRGTGVLDERMILGAGLYHPSAVGGDKGANTINFGQIYQNGTLIPIVDVAGINTWSGTNYFPGAVSFTGGVYGSTTYFGDNNVTGNNAFSGTNTFSGSNTFSVSQYSNTGAGDLHGWIFSRSVYLNSSAILIDNIGGPISVDNRLQAHFLYNGNYIGKIKAILSSSGNGDIQYQSLSDGRLKHGVTPLVSGDVIDRLNPIRYRLSDDDDEPEMIGFSAQELYEVVPQAASPGKGEPGDEDFTPWMRSMGVLEPVLVAEVKALRARVAALEAA